MVTKKKKPPARKRTTAAALKPVAPAPPPSKPMYDFPAEDYDEFLLLDDDDWLVLETAFVAPGGEDLADRLALFLALIVQALESGPLQAARAVYTLKDAIRICYKYTRTHKLALRLYNLSLTNPDLGIGGPLVLIEGELKRVGVVIEDPDDREESAKEPDETTR
jgi:hypothetical protein